MTPPVFDIVIVGSGAGGGTMARALAGSGARILLLERGERVPREDENWDPAAVWRDLRYRSSEQWQDGITGEWFTPYTHANVGGNTKFWGSVLYRLRLEDFSALEHEDGTSPAWPITYDDLAPFYDQAEAWFGVRGLAGSDPTDPRRGPFPHAPVPHAPEVEAVAQAWRRAGLSPAHLPLGLLRPGEPGGCVLCRTCNSFPCRLGQKSDAEVCAVDPALDTGAVTLWTGAMAQRLLTDETGRRVTGVEVDHQGQRITVGAGTVVVSAGAVHSAALLLRSASSLHPDGLANGSGLVGRRYMAHLATMMQGVQPFRVNRAVFQKTLALNDFYLKGPDGRFPLGNIQSQGRTHGIMAKVVGDTMVPGVPLAVYEAWVARGLDWLVMSEDLPRPDNRVTLDSQGRIRLHYRPDNVRTHDRLVRLAKRMLRDLGDWAVVAHSHRTRNTTHQCGTLVFGTDPATSVLDPWCRTHEVRNLWVVDGSFFPSSAAVNPGLTIVAQALRVAERLLKESSSWA